MIETHIVTGDYKVYLETAYKRDGEFLDKHRYPEIYGENTWVGQHDFALSAHKKSLTFRIVLRHGYLIGFFATAETDDLSSLEMFFVFPKYRTRETLEMFSSEIKTVIGEKFYICVLPKINHPACNFVKKMGFEYFSEFTLYGTDHEFTNFKIN